MIVQGWKQSQETSVNKLLFAGSRMSVGSSGAVPVEVDVDLAIGHTG